MHHDRVNFRWYSINCYPMYTSERQFVGVGGIARDISSIKGFEQEIRTQNDRLATLNEIAGTVNQSLNLDTILQNVLDKVLQILAVQAGGIFLFDQATETFAQRTCHIHSKTITEEKQKLLHFGCRDIERAKSSEAHVPVRYGTYSIRFKTTG